MVVEFKLIRYLTSYF